jgi:Protein of unknown function (DUF3021).
MKKKILIMGLWGFPLGVFIGYMITVIISLAIADGHFYPTAPGLAEQCGSEINAVTLQFLLAGVLGSACAAGSGVWLIESWSLLKQTVVHFLILSISMLPIAYFSYWMEHTLLGIITYFGMFIGLYVVIWISQYLALRHRIKKINAKISEQ